MIDPNKPVTHLVPPTPDKIKEVLPLASIAIRDAQGLKLEPLANQLIKENSHPQKDPPKIVKPLRDSTPPSEILAKYDHLLPEGAEWEASGSAHNLPPTHELPPKQ